MRSFVNTLRRGLLWVALPAAFAFTSCSDDDNTNNPADARVMVFHAAPYSSAEIDVLVDGQKKEDVDYGDESDYLSVAAGARALQIRNRSTQAELANASLNAESGKRYSIFAYNESTSLVRLLTLTDDYATPANNTALVRFVNVGFNAPAITLTTQGAGATPIATSIAKLAASGFVSVPANSVTLEAREATGGQATLTSKNTRFEAGKVYNVTLYGAYNGTGATALQLEVEDL